VALKPGSGALAAATAALGELEWLGELLRAHGLPPERVVVEPLALPHSDYFSATLFQVHLVAPISGSSAVVAVGGRYDQLLRGLWPPGAAPPGAVGATINVERLARQVAAAEAAAAAAAGGGGGAAAGWQSVLSAAQSDVLVCSRGGDGALGARAALVGLLQAQGVRAELLHRVAPSLTEQYEYAAARGIRWLAILEAPPAGGGGGAASGGGEPLRPQQALRVKSVDGRSESSMTVADLPRWRWR
jgi:translation initiation factor 2-alpha kinase 4